MKQNIRTSFTVLASVALLGFSGAGFARGGHHHHGGNGSSTHLVASLAPVVTSGTATNAGSGLVSYKSDATTGKTALHVSLNLPIAAGSVIPTIDAAAASIFLLTDTTTGTVCTLAIKEIDFVPTETATYTAQDAVTATTFSDVVCTGSATLAAGDAISITLSGDTTNTALLSGTLAAPTGFFGKSSF